MVTLATDDAEELARTVVAIVAHLDDQEPWRLDALCREHPEIDWCDPSNDEAARAICARCAVSGPCATYAAAHGALGVWAGTVAPKVAAPPPGPWWRCLQCGQEFQRVKRSRNRPDPMFCSASCSGKMSGKVSRPNPRRRVVIAKTSRAVAPSRGRARCDDCGGVLPPGRTGLCCACEEAARPSATARRPPMRARVGAR